MRPDGAPVHVRNHTATETTMSSPYRLATAVTGACILLGSAGAVQASPFHGSYVGGQLG